MNITGSFTSSSHWSDGSGNGAFSFNKWDDKMNVTMQEAREWYRLYYDFNASRSWTGINYLYFI